MKKFLFILLAVVGLAFVSCEQEPTVVQEDVQLTFEQYVDSKLIQIYETPDVQFATIKGSEVMVDVEGTFWKFDSKTNDLVSVDYETAKGIYENPTRTEGDCNPNHCDPCVNHTEECRKYVYHNFFRICCEVNGQCNME